LARTPAGAPLNSQVDRNSLADKMQISIEQERPDSVVAVQLLIELDHHLQQHPYPQESRHAFSIDKLLREGVVFFVTSCGGEPAGCGGLKLFGTDYAEVKRMYVRPVHRGLGLGKAMLNHLREFARERQVSLLRLETGIYETEAIGLYERFGFVRRTPFGEYKEDPLSVYFQLTIHH
jgi:putative acetyltransferase